MRPVYQSAVDKLWTQHIMNVASSILHSLFISSLRPSFGKIGIVVQHLVARPVAFYRPTLRLIGLAKTFVTHEKFHAPRCNDDYVIAL